MSNPPKLTPDQYRQILEAHPKGDGSNILTWKDTWKIFGTVTGVFVLVGGGLFTIFQYYLSHEIKDAIDKSEASLHDYVDKRCQPTNHSDNLLK